VKKVLNDMRRYGVVEFVMMRYGKVGAPSATFRVMPGAVVTRPATAAIVLKIYNHPHEPVPEEAFISEVQRMGLDDGEPLSSERVREEIEFAIRRGYIERIDDQPVRLGKGPRVDYERGFLELLVQTLRVFPTQTDSPSSKKQKLG